MLLIRLMLVAIALLGLQANATVMAQEPVTPLKLQLQTKLDEIVLSKKLPGATLGVVLKDGTALNIASGFQDVDVKSKMTVGSRMMCGSTGKTFVSAVALQLVAEGKIKLDELVSEYVDSEMEAEWFSKLPNAKSMTVRSLMNHTSGLPRYLFQESYLADLKSNPMKSRTPVQGLMALHGVEPLNRVGEGWAYSDSNYLVVGLIIEKVTQKKFYDVAQARLLSPLKLSNTRPSTGPKLDGLIQGHIGSVNLFDLPTKTVENGQYVMNPVFEWCGGGFVTNTSDLAVWLHALHTGKVLDEKMHSQLVASVGFRSGSPSDQGYGLGSFVWENDNGKFFGHAGIMPGYLTQIEFSEKHQFSIAFQTNTDEGMGQGLHQHVQSFAQLVVDAID